ncbi:MAG: hypothetical protein MI723_11055, partial [Caulobacterales bacterium]|nr:hypothetical protein [Caulobacterales bacterium]
DAGAERSPQNCHGMEGAVPGPEVTTVEEPRPHDRERRGSRWTVSVKDLPPAAASSTVIQVRPRAGD